MEHGTRKEKCSLRKKEKTYRNIHAIIQACPSLLVSFTINATDALKSVPLSEELLFSSQPLNICAFLLVFQTS